jgi:transposase
MTKPFSIAFKEKMVERLSGANAMSARKLSEETGISQETLSRWLRDARSLPWMPPPKKSQRRMIDDKVRIMSEAAKLNGSDLAKFLSREGVLLGELEQWRLALDQEDRAGVATTKRIHRLERELARKEKALAEAAALLVLKKKVDQVWVDEDDDTDEPNEK